MDALAELAERRAGIEGQLEVLRGRRGAAVLDGLECDDTSITAAEQELAAIMEAEAEATRRARKSAQDSRQREQEQIRRSVLENEKRRLGALAVAEKACGKLAASLAEALEAGGVIDAGVRLLGHKPALGFADMDRMSRLMTAGLRPLIRYNRRLGLIEFPEPRDCDAGSWAEKESALAQQVMQLIQKEQDNA